MVTSNSLFNKIEMIFLPIYRQTFSGVFEQFSFTSKFLGLKNHNSTFFKKNGFESSFYKIDILVVTSWSVRHEKTPNN